MEEDMSAQSQPGCAASPATSGSEPSAAEKCPGCYETSETEPVKVKRDGVWVESTVRRCVNRECHTVREGSLEDRVAHINSVYGYKYFGDYELSPEQLDVVGEAVDLANRALTLTAELAKLRHHLGLIGLCPLCAGSHHDRHPGACDGPASPAQPPHGMQG